MTKKKIFKVICCGCNRLAFIVGEQEGNELVEFVESPYAGECVDCASGDYVGSVKVKAKPFKPTIVRHPLAQCQAVCGCGTVMFRIGVDPDDQTDLPTSPAIGICTRCSETGDFGFPVTVSVKILPSADQAESEDPADDAGPCWPASPGSQRSRQDTPMTPPAGSAAVRRAAKPKRGGRS